MKRFFFSMVERERISTSVCSQPFCGVRCWVAAMLLRTSVAVDFPDGSTYVMYPGSRIFLLVSCRAIISG